MDQKDDIILEPQTAAFIEKITKANLPPIYTLEVKEARHLLDRLQDESESQLPADLMDVTLPCGPTGKVSVCIYRPASQQQRQIWPACIYFHGGGWILGNRHTHDRLVRDLVHSAQVAVVFVNFTPAPEAQYPIPLEEAYAATQYIAEHASDYQLDSRRLAVAGDSAGGHMAATVALWAKERRGPTLAGQLLFYPVTDVGMDTLSYRQFAEGPWLTKAAMEWFWEAFCPGSALRSSQAALSPWRSSSDQLQGLPPTLVLTAEYDVLRDEGEAYAHKLMQAGCDVTAVRFLGTIHDFLLINALANTPACKSALTLTGAHLRKIFSL